MKTPENIKKGLFCCWEDGCTTCPYDDDCTMGENFMDVARDALTYIQQLESRLAQVERERDAAVADLDTALNDVDVMNLDCNFCKHKDRPVCESCEWEWRGVCEENTKEEST